LHLANHPSVTAALQNNGQPEFKVFFRSHSHHPLVERIIYRQDAQSQFRDLSKFTVLGDQPTSKSSKKPQKGCAVGELTAVIHALATAHFRKRASASAAAVYSYDPGVSTCVPLGEAVHTGARALYPDIGADAGADHAQLVATLGAFSAESCLVDDSGEGPPPWQALIEHHRFFRVVHAKPSAQVLPNRAVAARPNELAICIHQVAGSITRAPLPPTVQLNLMQMQTPPQASACGNDGGFREDGTHLWSVPLCNSIDAMCRSVIEWSMANGSDITFELNRSSLRGLSQEQTSLARQVLNDLVAAGALPGGVERSCLRFMHSSAQQVKILEVMAREGLVECVFHSPEHSSWQLTKHAVMELKLFVTVQQPNCVFSGRTLSHSLSCLGKITYCAGKAFN
jgi:hypothetical protein